MPDHSDYPYPGPRPYRTDESELFAGRDHEIAELCSLIISHQVVVLYAQSGAGKSSLLNAGLIPVLKRKQVTVLPVSRVGLPIPTEVSPTDVKNVYAFSAIADLLPERQAAGAASDNETILDVIKRIPHEVDDAGELKLRMIAFDQFEELFSTHAHRWPERRSFIEQVSKALAADRMLRVLLVLREDYLATFGDFADLLPEQARTRYHLERLREPEALAAVLHPLEHTRWRFEDGVAETLVRDLLAITVETSSGTTTVTGEFVEPVQLQIVCSALLQRLPPGRTSITMSDLMAFGRPDEALQTFYDAAIEAISRMGFEERRVRAWFEMYLITPAGTRGLVFRGAETTGGLPNFIVDALERSHIIRPEIRSALAGTS